MKKGQIYEGVVERIDFPNKGIVCAEGRTIVVKNAMAGQKISFRVHKMRKGKCEAQLLEVKEKSPLELETANCEHFGICGGCIYQNVSYATQLTIKEKQVSDLLTPVLAAAGNEFTAVFEGVKKSPAEEEYRNKMEFSFGDTYKDGPLALGMHKRGSFYDIAKVENCRIVDEDYRRILRCVQTFFADKQISYFHKLRHEGYLRHLLVRKAIKTGEILIALVTSTQTEGLLETELLEEFKNTLQKIELKGKIAGILHIKNDSLADVVQSDSTDILYGQDFFYEELLGLKFKITPFSFFQTNSLGAEVLYETAREFILEALKDKKQSTVFDLYSGTGTIAQMLSSVAGKVIGVEIIEEAVQAAKENAAQNGLSNCEFIAGDVLKVLDTISEKPDFIVLDPPREGIHPKALEKIMNYGVENMLYISCKPTSLARDLEILQARGYVVERLCCVDMFPFTGNIETVVLLSKGEVDSKKVRVEFSLEDTDM